MRGASEAKRREEASGETASAATRRAATRGHPSARGLRSRGYYRYRQLRRRSPLTHPTVLVVDNYDSFAYNLVQYVGEALLQRGADPHEAVVVRRNDAVTVPDVRDLDPDGIVVSPGPGTPAEAGVSVPIFRDLDYPTLGVCLGHQALCAANGVEVGRAPDVVHGKPSTVRHDGAGVYTDLPDRIEVGRYHSLAASGDLPDALTETAWTDAERVVMGVRHTEKPHAGVQFHPESILTEHGAAMVRAFVTDAAEG